MTTTERVHADHTVRKHLGNWTSAGRFEVRARSGAAVLDLRSPALPDDVEVHVDLRRAMVKLLVPEDAVVEHWDLAWTGKGRVKDLEGTEGRTIRLVGAAADSEIRVQRGGVAILSAMCSRAYLRDLRHAHRTGTMPTVDDPARVAG